MIGTRGVWSCDGDDALHLTQSLNGRRHDRRGARQERLFEKSFVTRSGPSVFHARQHRDSDKKRTTTIREGYTPSSVVSASPLAVSRS